jgi:APA family basic amino acid/polyamine antiporter
MSSSVNDSNLILLAWILAGFVSMLGAFNFATLATTTKEAGGQFQYFKNIFGDFFGFIYGWSFFTVISTASIASIAYVFAESLVSLFHLHSDMFAQYAHIGIANHIYPFENALVKFIAVGTLIFLTLFNILGVQGGGWLSNVVTSAKIIGILLLIYLGLTYDAPESQIQVVAAKTYSSSDILQVSAFFTAMLGAFWAYDGWVNITNMASEFKHPTKNIPRAIILGTALTTLLYLLANYAYLQVFTPEQFAKLYATNGNIAAVAVAEATMGTVGITIISTLIMVSTFGATQASTMSAARVYYQMSKEGYFFKPFAKVHKKFHTPHISLLGQMVWASLLILSGSFDQLTDMLVFAAFIFYAMGAVAVMKLKIEGKIESSFGYPVVPILFLVSCIVIVINAIYSRPTESLSGLVLITLGIPLYFYFKRQREKE